MQKLTIRHGKITDPAGNPVFLRGTCIGGWMNMENFINGYPGSEHGLRQAALEILGAARAEFFFDRLLDHFFNESDISYLARLGATVVRLPLNYRHFEIDQHPFQYLESGFRRLDQALQWCERHGIYAILDLHAVQGWQNADWHCDNCNRHSLIWTHPHFQDRFVALWSALAARYAGRAVIAGYDIMNEPVTNTPDGRFPRPYSARWDFINPLFRRTIDAIRAVDRETIIFLEGDSYAVLFEGFEEPQDDQIAYSSHNYTSAGFGPGAYPGIIRGRHWDSDLQRGELETHEGFTFTRKHNRPLWAGEFGSVYNGPPEEIPYRLKALDDQLALFREHQVHWTTWTYKDVGVMGLVQLDPQSDYLQRIQHLLRAKALLKTDFWMSWLPDTPAKAGIAVLARLVEDAIADPGIDPASNERYLLDSALAGYAGELMQPAFMRCFAGLTEPQLDACLASFSINQARKFNGLEQLLIQHFKTTTNGDH